MVNQDDNAMNEEVTFSCDLCGRKFKEASHFTKHKRGALCKKLIKKQKSKTNGQLKIDDDSDSKKKKKKKKGLNNIKPYQCNVCGARFYDRGNVEMHLERQHQAHKNLWVEVYKYSGHVCSQCDKWFRNEKELKIHEKKRHMSYSQGSTSNVSGQSSSYYNGHDQNGTPYTTPLDHLSLNNSVQSSLLPLSSSSVNQSEFSTTACSVSNSSNSLVPLQPLHVHTHLPGTNSTDNNDLCDMVSPILNCSTSNSNSGSNAILPSNSESCLYNFNQDKPGDVIPYDKYKNEIKPKACLCGDCGYKFIDIMNLELHIQRKHSSSKIIETISLGGGTYLFRTDNTVKSVEVFIKENEQNKVEKNPQTYDCLLCGFRTSGLNTILPHLQIVHNTTNSNFIHIIETLEIKKGSKGSKLLKKIKTEEPFKIDPTHTCEFCNTDFLSKAELVRHKIKDKHFMCGVCCFSSCSQFVLTEHMSHHGSSYGNLANNEQIGPQNIGFNSVYNGEATQFDMNTSDVLCWVCGFSAPSITNLDHHLRAHGTPTLECRLCHKTTDTLADMMSHLRKQHQNQQNSITCILTSNNSTPITHNLMISPEGGIIVSHNFSSNNSSFNSNLLMQVSSVKMKEPVITGNRYNNGTSRGFNNKKKSAEIRLPPSYACSVCNTCLANAAELETHLEMHQNANNVNGSNFGPINHGNSASPSLCRIEGSIEFRCEECGFWRAESEPVMRHINAVHMSGDMLHSVRHPSGKVQVYPIHVVTPVSSIGSAKK